MRPLILAIAALSTASFVCAAETAEDASKMQYVRMNTSKGDLLLMLDPVAAPISVENFTRYAKEGGYDGTIFHRVMPGFMIQGGGFEPGLIKRETNPPIKNEWQNGLKNTRGTIAMARLGRQPDSATNQFFINVADNGFLDQPRDGAGYAVFGKVVAGDDVLDAIKGCETGHAHGVEGGHYDDVPVEDVIINEVKLVTPEQAEALAKGCRSSEGKWRERQVALAAEIKNEQAEKAAMSVQDVCASPATLPGDPVNDAAVQQSDSGLAWFDLVEGTGDTPADASTTVRVHYTGWLVDGTKFDSSVDRGETIDFPLNRVIPGWTEGRDSLHRWRGSVPREGVVLNGTRPGTLPNQRHTTATQFLAVPGGGTTETGVLPVPFVPPGKGCQRAHLYKWRPI